VQRAESLGLASMRHALWRRALKLYGCQVALLLFAFTTAAVMQALDHQQAIRGLLEFYFQYPWTAMWNGLVLLYNPPLLDILPMYILFMTLTPLVLTWALRRGWTEPLTLSVALWLFAQFGLRQLAYQPLLDWTGAKIPLEATGSFDIFAWQLMWMLGLSLGAMRATAGRSPAVPRGLVIVALGIALPLIAWRHLIGQSPFGSDLALNALFDKWHLGPLRVIDFGALLVLGLHYGPRWQGWIRTRFLTTLGAASLPVYCFHIVTCILMLCMVEDYGHRLSALQQGGLLAASLLLLYGIAVIALRPARAPAVLPAPRVRSEARSQRT